MSKKITILLVAGLMVSGIAIGYILSRSTDSDTTGDQADYTEAVKQGMEELSQVQTGTAVISYDLTTADSPAQAGLNALFTGTLSFDAREKNNRRSLLTGDMTFTARSNQTVIDNYTLLTADNQTYLKLADITVDSGTPTLVATVNQVKDQWYTLGGTEQSSSLSMLSGQLSEISASRSLQSTFDVGKLSQALLSSSALDSLEKLGEEVLDDVETTRYSLGALSPEDTAALLEQLQTTANAAASDADKLAHELSQANLTGEIWVRKDDNTIKKIKLNFGNTEGLEPNLKLGIEINLQEINQPVVITAPETSLSYTVLRDALLDFPELTTTDVNNPGNTNDTITEDDTLPEIN